MPLGKLKVLINRIDKENYQNTAEIATDKQSKALASALEN